MTGVALLGALVITGGTVHPGDGPPVEASVLIVDGRITALSPKRLPAGARRIDATGKVITPGFIESQSMLGLVEIDLVAGTRDEDPQIEHPVRAAFRAADAFNPDSGVLPAQWRHGITTALAVPRGGLVAGRALAFDLGAEPFAPEVAMQARFGEVGKGSRAASMGLLRALVDDTRAYRSNRAAFERNQYRRLAASRLDLEAMIPVVEGRLPLVVHVHRRADIRALVTWAGAERIRLVLAGATEAWMEAPRLARARVPVILNPIKNLPRSFDHLHPRDDVATRLAEAGVPVILSTFDTHMARTLRQVAGNAVRAGLAHDAALRAITAAPADAFGLKGRGRIRPGAVANLVIWSGDPFEPSSRAEHVIIGGAAASQRSRQRALFERYRTLPATR